MANDARRVTLPYRFAMRSYQREFWEAMVEVTPDGRLELKRKRAVCVWHRRAGKDKNVINFLATMAYYHRVGVYAYFFPTFSQGKRIVWDGLDRDGFRFLDHFPPELVYDKNETELQVTLRHPDDWSKPGSVIYILGTDQEGIDRIVGMNIIGAVYSEYALQNPMAWRRVQPMLNENGGWAVFISTPRGENHFYKLYKSALDHRDRWFVSLKTVDDTFRDAEGEDGTPVITQAQIDQDVADGMDEETVQQEYYVSFRGSVYGSYFGRLMNVARDEERIGRVPWIPRYPVFTAWDIGSDTTAIWFGQRLGEKVHWIDYYQNAGEGLAHYAKIVNNKEYQYEAHWFPHDLEHDEWGSSASRRRIAEEQLGRGLVRVVKTPDGKKYTLEAGIERVRQVLPVSYFDEVKCEQGIEALFAYRKEWDEAKQAFKGKPLHDWASHPADAFRQGCLAFRPGFGQIGRYGQQPVALRSETDWSPFAEVG